MKKNTKKEQKEFYNGAIKLLEQFCTKCENGIHQYEIMTRWGGLGISIHDDNTFVYSVFMRFLDGDKVRPNEIVECLSGNLNKHSYKWNIMSSDSEWLLDVLEDRLVGINSLIDDKFFIEVMST